MTVVTIASLSILSLIATIKSVDTLSVVALALAVIAFVVQIIVFIVQTAAANEQQAKAQDIHSQTIRVLTQIEERTAGTQQTVSSMNEQFIARLLDKALPAVTQKGVGIDTPGFVDALAQSITTRLSMTETSSSMVGRGQDEELGDVIASFPPRDSNESRNRAIREALRRLPRGRHLELTLGMLKDLNEQALIDLAWLGHDEITSRSPDSSFGPGLSSIEPEPLLARGLIQAVRDIESAIPIYILTPKGREAVRIFTADPPIPDSVPYEWRTLRERIRQEVETIITPRAFGGHGSG